MEFKPGLYDSAMSKFHYPPEDRGRDYSSGLNSEIEFIMRCNGYFPGKKRGWFYGQHVVKRFAEEFNGQRVSFFGPDAKPEFFNGVMNFVTGNAHSRFLSDKLLPNISSDILTEAISKYRTTDVDQAARIAYMVGGVIRHLASNLDSPKSLEINSRITYMVNMLKLAEGKSTDALVSAMAMYVMSAEVIEDDKEFKGAVFNMSEAIRLDEVQVSQTSELGLSQVSRLRTYLDLVNGVEPRTFLLKRVTNYLDDFNGFATTGAEFHFDYEYLFKQNPNVWKKLALLNMSMYQPGNYVQTCRDDKGVLEVRMNPSYWPVTIANWKLMRFVLPELDKAPFHTTYNRGTIHGDFTWGDDLRLISSIKALGLLCYSGNYGEVLETFKSNEIAFGSHYLGQTFRVDSGTGNFSGVWGGNDGKNGQLSIYAGIGDNLPDLAYYPSMVLSDPRIIEGVSSSLSRINNLGDAMECRSDEASAIFNRINREITKNDRLHMARASGEEIMELLAL